MGRDVDNVVEDRVVVRPSISGRADPDKIGG